MKKKYALLTIGLILNCVDLFGCSCVGEKSVKEEFRDSEVVFMGSIISSEEIKRLG